MPPIKRKPTARTRIVKAENSLEEQAHSREASVLRRTYFYGLLTVATFAAGILIGYMLWGYTPTPKPVVYNIETEGFPSLGPVDAPIVIVEYSDFQCPYCYRAYEQIYKPILAAYPGKIRFVFRNFPLSFHPNATASAEAALCAGDQGAYWEYHNALFDNYIAIYQEDQGRLLDQGIYNQFASNLGLDVVTFERCMTSRKYQQFILDDMDYASNLPPDSVTNECGVAASEPAVGGTPSFFVNGHRIGGLDLEKFKKIIDAELEKLD